MDNNYRKLAAHTFNGSPLYCTKGRGSWKCWTKQKATINEVYQEGPSNNDLDKLSCSLSSSSFSPNFFSFSQVVLPHSNGIPPMLRCSRFFFYRQFFFPWRKERSKLVANRQQSTLISFFLSSPPPPPLLVVQQSSRKMVDLLSRCTYYVVAVCSPLYLFPCQNGGEERRREEEWMRKGLDCVDQRRDIYWSHPCSRYSKSLIERIGRSVANSELIRHVDVGNSLHWRTNFCAN